MMPRLAIVIVAIACCAFGPILTPQRLSLAMSSVFSPDQVPGLVAWLDASALALTNGAPVSIWTATGSANSPTQNTANAQPVFISAELNGHPVIRFDGTNDYLQLVAYTNGIVSQPLTVFYVMRTRVLSVGAAVATDGGEAANRCNVGFQKNVGGTTNYTLGFYAGGTDSADVIANFQTNFHIFEITYSGSNTLAYTNGVQLAYDPLRLPSATIPGTNGMNGVTLGTRPQVDNYWSYLDIAEAEIFSGNMASNNRASIRAYLRSKWGL